MKKLQDNVRRSGTKSHTVAREPDAVAREPSNSLPDMDGPDYTDSEGSHSEFEGFGPDDIY